MIEFRFPKVFMSKFLFVAFSLTSPGLTRIYIISIFVFFHAVEVAGAISWTPISNYDQSWECVKFTLVIYSYQNSFRVPLALLSF